MKTYLQAIGFVKFAEKDNYQKGCSLEGGYATADDNYRFRANTQEEMIEQLISFVPGATDDSVELNSCDETGRVDIQVMENDEGREPTHAEMSCFRKGDIDLWSVTYTFRIKEITEKDFDLIEKVAV